MKRCVTPSRCHAVQIKFWRPDGEACWMSWDVKGLAGDLGHSRLVSLRACALFILNIGLLLPQMHV